MGKLKSILLAALLFAVPANGALTEPDRSLIQPRIILANPGFESYKSDWTASGGTFNITTTAANVGTGNAAASWDSGSAAQTFTSKSYPIPAGLYGRNVALRCRIQTPTGTATHTIGGWDGSTLINPVTITSSTQYTSTTINFIMPSSGTMAIRLTSVASDEPNINIDDCYLGLADNIFQVSQANLVASGFFATTASCTVTRANTALGAFGTAAACPGPTVETNNGPGTLLTTDVDLPTKFTVNNLPPGTYEIKFMGPSNISTSNQSGAWAINDGTTTFGQVGTNHETGGTEFSVAGIVTYTTAGNRTFELYTSAAANSVSLDITSSNKQVYFSVTRFPNSSQLAFSPDQVPASWAGYHTQGGAVWSRTNTAYGDPANSGTAAIVETDNRNFGTVITTASNVAGITLTFPRSGKHFVCANAELEGSTVGAYVAAALTDGTVTIAENGMRVAVANTGQVTPLCHVYNATAGVSTTLKIQLKASSGSASINNTSLTSRGSIEWSIVELDAPMPAPFMQNMLVTASNGVERTIRANLTCSASSAVNHQDGTAFTSIGNIASGKCSVVIPAATFSSTAYDCGAMVNGTAVTSIVGSNVNNKSSTGFDVYFALISTGSSTIAAATSVTFDILCRGPS